MHAPIQMPAMPTTRMTSITTHCQWLEILENGELVYERRRGRRIGRAYQSPLAGCDWKGIPVLVEVLEVEAVVEGATPFWMLQTL